jgi:Mg-chelatase subunit ChlD
MRLDLANPAALWLLLLLVPIGLIGWKLGVQRRRLAPAALWLRLGTVALLALALAQPLLAAGSAAAGTVFVVDRSRSVGGDTSGAADRWLADALAGAGSEDRAALVAFAAAPHLAAPAAPARSLDPASVETVSDGERDHTDLESALALARALPLGGGRRIVLVSDGAENAGEAGVQAAQAAAEGVPIDVLPLPGAADDDLRVEGVTAPGSVWAGEPVTVLASVHSPAAGAGIVELWSDGAVLASREVELPAGLSSHAFEAVDLGPGFHALEVRVRGDAALDRTTENDVLPLATVVRDQPRVLLVVPEGADAGVMRGALERGGAEVAVVPPAETPSRLSELAAFDATVLDNVPASDLSLDQMAGLREATRTLGRGLVVVGGTAAYGPGGYAGTVLEDLLPVTVKVTDGRQRQQVALLLIIDKSGSMSYDPLGGEGKIAMAKEAARLAARSLADGDQVGILMFNDRQEWVVPMTTIEGEESRLSIDRRIEGISADGGTEILPALSVGLDGIRNVEADARHVVLLSDGKSRTGTRESYQTLLEDALGERTTLSTIAIGEDADTDLLNFLADQGGGRYHFTERPEDIPAVTLEEAQSAGSQSIIRGEFQPIQVAPSPMLARFEPEDLPPLDGYDFAEVKPDAQSVLESSREDPVLAKWQVGLGRVVAWTADNGTDLAARWGTWERADEFWSGVIRWALPDPENRPLQVASTVDGADAVVTVRAAGDGGAAPGAAGSALGALSATITTPSGAVVADRQLAQTAPGEFQLRIADPEPGAYRLDLAGGLAGGQAGGETGEELAAFVVAPSPELRPDPAALARLQTLAAQTGGRVLSLDDPAAAFAAPAPGGSPLRDYRPLWPAPLALALLLFLADVAVRMGAFRRA